MSGWKYPSPTEPGFHTVITPQNSECKSLWFFRLNLPAGDAYTLYSGGLELSAVVIAGRVQLEQKGLAGPLGRLDAFYLPGSGQVEIRALENTILYIGGSQYEGEGDFFVRRYDPDLPLGEIRQVHGKPPYQRDVWMTINQEVPGSRLITGVTWGQAGQWTSWPPHQHEKDLEEVYAYFDIPAPKFALHLSYTRPGTVEAVTSVSSGDCVIIPAGYHPTVAMPGVRSCYFWVMAAHSRSSRRYDLSIPDPNFAD